MPDDPAAVRQHYATEKNLAGRQQLFAYAAQATTPSIESYFVWPDDAVVLDVGCGNGLWTAHAAARTARGLTVGVDLSAGIIASARQRAETALYCQADASSLPFRESIADAILAFWMLYHVPDKSRAFREIKRLLKPGGWFMAATNANRGLGILDDIFTEAASFTLGRPVDGWFPSLDFSLENGEEVLGPFFGDIGTHIGRVPFSVPEVEPIVVYASTLRDPVVAHLGNGFDFDSFLDTVTRLTQVELAHGPITFERRSALFVARTDG